MDIENQKEDIAIQLQADKISEMISVSVICRLCANQNDKLIGIYSEDGCSNDLATKMNLYLPIKVSETDQLPLQCCWQCASTLLAWHDLVVASVEADRRLRSCQFVSAVIETEPNIEVLSQPETPLNAYCQTEVVADESLTVGKKDSIIFDKPTITLNILSSSSDEDYSHMKLDDDDAKEDFDAAFEDDSEVLEKVGDSIDVNLFQYQCQFCEKIFLSEKEISAHMNECHSDNLKTADGKEQAKGRKRYHKLDQEMVNAAKVVVDGKVYYNCKECGKSLFSPYTYVWHMRIHSGERPYVCDLCGKQFRIAQGLVRHLKETHAKIKNFPCDICGRMFATKRNVEEHRRIHTNERPYICDLCGKSFKQKASLFVHNRSHNNLFPFKCSYCNQGFRTKPPLLIHITRHTGEKPYPCQICGRCFRIKYELKRHMLIHSDVKPFSCSLCGVAFRQKRYLRNHMKQNHPNIQMENEESKS